MEDLNVYLLGYGLELIFLIILFTAVGFWGGLSKLKGDQEGWFSIGSVIALLGLCPYLNIVVLGITLSVLLASSFVYLLFRGCEKIGQCLRRRYEEHDDS
jgi:hypothetical protein